MIFLPPAQVKPVQARPAIEVAVLSFCREVAAQMGSEDLEFKADPKRLETMRKQALQLRQACKKKLPKDSTTGPLLDAALGSLEAALNLDTQLPEPQGSFRYGKAAKVLAMGYKIHLRDLGTGNRGLLPDLEALALLHRIAGLRDFHWRDEALRIRVKQPDPSLEKDLAVAIEDHYGPWLTAVELEPMLEFCEHLAQSWLRCQEAEELNRKVLELGLKSNATRVWRLAARKGSESLREDLSALLKRLDPAARPSHPKSQETFVELGEFLQKTPLESQARSLLKRVDAFTTSSSLKRRIARALGDWNDEAKLLEAELKETDPRDSLSLLHTAAQLLREHPQKDLLEEGTRVLKAAIQLDVAELSPLMEQWMPLLQQSDRKDEAEECLRLWLPQADSSPEACAFLARMGLWNELESRLAAFRNEKDPHYQFWRFQGAKGLGRDEEAQRWIQTWVENLLILEPKEIPSFPGASDGVFLFQTHPGQIVKLATHLGSSLLPGQERMLQQEPWRILVALDPEAPANLLPEKLEQALRWRMDRMPHGPGRSDALKKLLEEAEEALGTSHPALAEVLLELAKEEESESIPHLERALSILGKTPEDRTVKLIEIHGILANAKGLIGDRRGLEQESRRIIELLEVLPSELKGETRNLPEEVALPLLLHFWREQSFEELALWSPRILALVQRTPKEDASIESNTAELTKTLASFDRLARLQIQLKAAGLP